MTITDKDKTTTHFYRDGDRIVQRTKHRNEFGEDQRVDVAMPENVAAEMLNDLLALLSKHDVPPYRTEWLYAQGWGVVGPCEYKERGFQDRQAAQARATSLNNAFVLGEVYNRTYGEHPVAPAPDEEQKPDYDLGTWVPVEGDWVVIKDTDLREEFRGRMVRLIDTTRVTKHDTLLIFQDGAVEQKHARPLTNDEMDAKIKELGLDPAAIVKRGTALIDSFRPVAPAPDEEDKAEGGSERDRLEHAVHALTGDEGEDDALTVLERYVANRPSDVIQAADEIADRCDFADENSRTMFILGARTALSEHRCAPSPAKAGKVLTDEEAFRIGAAQYEGALTPEQRKERISDLVPTMAELSALRGESFACGMRHARDNGYLAPAAPSPDTAVNDQPNAQGDE